MTLNAQADRLSDKSMLRVYSGQQKGATAFFRNRPLLDSLAAQLREAPGTKIRVLFHAGSIGAEAYSFVIHSLIDGLASAKSLEIYATDINADFLEFAERGCYPLAVLEAMTETERSYFEPAGDGMVQLVPDVRRLVKFLPACSFVDAQFEEPFDVVFILNALTYVSPTEQTLCLNRVAAYARFMLIVCAFHPDTIERDLRSSGFTPVLDRIREIHDAWTERIRTECLPEPGSPEYSWVIPPFSEIPSFEYRYCSVFRKTR